MGLLSDNQIAKLCCQKHIGIQIDVHITTSTATSSAVLLNRRFHNAHEAALAVSQFGLYFNSLSLTQRCLELIDTSDHLVSQQQVGLEQQLTLQSSSNYNGRFGTISSLISIDLKTKEIMPMLENFQPTQISRIGQNRCISYGNSSYGYDLRCSNKFKIFSNVHSKTIDPKNIDDLTHVDIIVEDGGFLTIPPNGFILTNSIERFHMPEDVIGICLGKSTYARSGIDCIVTPAEPGWSGYLTLEFSNTTPAPVKFYPNEGCAQMLFFQGDDICKTSYATRSGKYMNQDSQPICSRMLE